MPPQKKTSKNKKNRKSNQGSGSAVRELLFADPEQDYAVVLRPLGCRMLQVRMVGAASEGKEAQCHIRGSLKRCYVRPGDVVLVARREFERSVTVVDLIHKYQPDEVRNLAHYGEITAAAATADDGPGGGGWNAEQEIAFEDFTDEVDDEEDDRASNNQQFARPSSPLQDT